MPVATTEKQHPGMVVGVLFIRFHDRGSSYRPVHGETVIAVDLLPEFIGQGVTPPAHPTAFHQSLITTDSQVFWGSLLWRYRGEIS